MHVHYNVPMARIKPTVALYRTSMMVEMKKCKYREAGKKYLGLSTLHSLPWLTQNISTFLKV